MTNRLSFSEAKLRAFKPTKTTTFYDTQSESYGLSCIVGPNGRHRTFYWRRRVAGKLTRVRIGPVGVVFIDDARRHCRELAQAVFSVRLSCRRMSSNSLEQSSDLTRRL